MEIPDTSLGMVDRADVFIGIYAYRYGHVPKGSKISITEMEFDRAEARARERKLTILPFLMDAAHPLTADQVEANAAARQKLERLKARASEGRGRVFFKSPAELRGKVETALKTLMIRAQAERLLDAEQTVMLLKMALDDAQAALDRKDAELRALQDLLDAQAARAGGRDWGPVGLLELDHRRRLQRVDLDVVEAGATQHLARRRHGLRGRLAGSHEARRRRGERAARPLHPIREVVSGSTTDGRAASPRF